MSAVRDQLSPKRLTHVVDVGANPLDGGRPPYLPMLKAGLCRVTGFEPQQRALSALLLARGPNEMYLPYAVGDGSSHTLKICRAMGMTSLLEPDSTKLGLFAALRSHGEVTERIPVETRRLDDISEIEHLDFLKIDIQGSELSVFHNGREKLAEAVVIQTEVSFVTLYLDQPSFGDVDSELRAQGFIPHAVADVSRRPIGDFEVGDDALPWVNQVVEADMIYVRDFTRPDVMTDEQLRHLALIAHHCYRSFDLVFRCVQLLEERHAVETGTSQQYRCQLRRPT